MTVEVNLMTLLRKTQATEGSDPAHGDDMQRQKIVLGNFARLSRLPDARYTHDYQVHLCAVPTAPDKEDTP